MASSSASRTRVVHVIDHLRPGGAQHVLRDLVSSLDGNRYVVTVCCLGQIGYVATELGARGVNVEHLDVERRHILSGIRRLAALLTDPAPSIIHTHLGAAKLMTRMAVGRLPSAPPVVVHEHSMNERTCRFPFVLLDRRQLRRTAATIAVSHHLAHWLIDRRTADRDKLHVVHNGVDLDAFTARPVPSQPGVVGYIGRLAPEKGIDTLIDTVPAVIDRCPHARFVIAGAGPLRERLADRVTTMDVASHVRFAGEITDTASFLQEVDVLACPSRTETFGLGILEAMASGVPVVAARVGGIPEVVENSVTGVLVPPGDPVALATALCSVLDNPSRWAQLARAGRTRAETHFSLQKMVQSVETVYAETLRP